MILPGIYNQGVRTPDCWVHATKWAAEASRPGIDQPTVTEFRAFAQDPRDGYRDGGSLDEVLAGARGSWPALTITRFDADFAEFDRQLDLGYPASLAVWSGKLPVGLRFGFGLGHQVGVIRTGGLTYVANPLAREESAPVRITTDALRVASTAAELGYGGRVRAALFPAPLEIDMPGLKVTAQGKVVSGVLRVTGDTGAIYLHDRTQRDPIAKGAVRQALATYERDWDSAPGYVITESLYPAWVGQAAGTFTPDAAQVDCDDAIEAAVQRDRARARITYA